MKRPKTTYAQVGDNYDTKDPAKKLAQVSAKKTSTNLALHGYNEVTETRGESAYVWKQGPVYMASVIEGLGTKNLVADALRKVTGKTYYDVVAHDTVATIINDLVTVGATPLVLHAYWAIGDNSWLSDKKRWSDFIRGWKKACDLAKICWGGGETPTLKSIVSPETIDLGGSAVGIISKSRNLLTDKNLKDNDRIILLKSNGINANGLSLARAVAQKLPAGYVTKLPGGKTYGKLLLTKTNIYASLIQALLQANIRLHYVTNITGHGLRKIMRARQNYTYILENIFPPQEVFIFIQKEAGLTDLEMYQTFNMGQDYALFLPSKDVNKALKIISRLKFTGLNAGFISRGKKQVLIKPRNLVLEGETLDLR